MGHWPPFHAVVAAWGLKRIFPRKRSEEPRCEKDEPTGSSPWLSWPGWWCQPLQPREKKQGCDSSCYSSSQVEFQIFKVVFSAWIGYSEMIPPRPFGNHVNHQPVLITSCDLRGRYLQIAESWHRISGELWGNTKVIEKDQPELVVTAKITMKINAKSNRIFFWIIGWGMREKTAF